MYSSYYNYPINNSGLIQPYTGQDNDERFIAGGFLGPFLLGGLAGAALTSPRRYPYYQPCCVPVPYYQPYYQPMPYYPPIY